MVFDDGVTGRLGETHYLMTDDLGPCRRGVRLARRMAAMRMARSRGLPDFGHDALGDDHARRAEIARGAGISRHRYRLEPRGLALYERAQGHVAGIPARLFRVSFTGELSFEINVPARYGAALWEALMAAGAQHGITPLGTEAMHVLRAEKGYHRGRPRHRRHGDAVRSRHGRGSSTSEGRLHRQARHRARSDLGRDRAAAARRALDREPSLVVPEGSQIVAGTPSRIGTPPVPMIGHVTSSYLSPTLGRSIALALIDGGLGRNRRDGDHCAGRSAGARGHRQEPLLRSRQGSACMADLHNGASSPLGAFPERARRSIRQRGLAARAAVPRPGQSAPRPRERRRARRRRGGPRPRFAARAQSRHRRRRTQRPVARPRRVPDRDQPGREAALVEALRQSLQGHRAAVTDVSDGRTIIEIAGRHARDVLAKGCGLDLHDRVFAPGQCAQSGLAKARILLRQLDLAPSYQIFVQRSHAEYLWLWLKDAAREYGLP